MSKINTLGSGKLGCRDMVNLAFPAFCRILCNNLLCPECQRFDGALISAEEIIKNINRKFVLVFGDNHFITALPEVIGCSMYGALQGLNSFLFLFRTPGVVPGLILKNQEKAPCDSFPGADLLHKAQIVFLHQTALLIFLLSHLPAYCVQMTVDVRPTGQHLDLQLDGRDFQIRHKRVDDIALLSRAAEHKVDGNHLDHLDIPVVFGVDDAVLDLFDGKIVCHRIQAGGRLLFDMSGALGRTCLLLTLVGFFLRFFGRKFFLRLFLGPELLTNLVTANLVKLSWKIRFTGTPALRRPRLLFFRSPLLEMSAGAFHRGRLLIRLLTIAANDAAIPQIFQKDNQKFRQTLARNADQCDQSRRKGGQAQNDNAGRQPERNKHEDRHPDGKSQDTGLNNIPRTEHTAEKCA